MKSERVRPDDASARSIALRGCYPLNDRTPEPPPPLARRLYWKKGDIPHSADDPANTFYSITKGMVAESLAFEDGRRQIVGISTVGDLCGYPEHDGRYLFTAEAVTDVEVFAFDRHSLYAFTARNADFADALARHVSDKLREAGLNLTAIGKLTATERLAHFLVKMRDLSLSLGESVQPFILHLNRQQIADYLSMNLETVSRAFTKLRHLNIIQLVEAETVVVLDEQKLLDLSNSLDPKVSARRFALSNHGRLKAETQPQLRGPRPAPQRRIDLSAQLPITKSGGY